MNGDDDLCECGHPRFMHAVQYPELGCLVWLRTGITSYQCPCEKFVLKVDG